VIEPLASGELLLSQPGYANKICREEGGSARHRTPSNANLFSEIDDQKIMHEENVTLFRSRLMSLMFLATRTRPDILKECTFLASFALNPGPKAFNKLKRVYAYVRKTMNKGISLNADTYTLQLVTDAAYGLHQNGRSHTGVIVTFYGSATAPIYCKSHVQKLVTLSSTESELVALVDGTKKLVSMVGLMEFFGLHDGNNPTVVLCDNQSVLHIIANGEGFSGKSRHMRVRWHFVHELLTS
jgi:hypothetical protein